jgi:hypothetical protein
MRSPKWISDLVRAAKSRSARRRAERPERLRRRAEAKAYRLEMKRRHEDGPWQGGGG